MPPTLLDELPLAPPATLGPFRDADYQALPDEPRCELIYGELVVTPAPNRRHQVLLVELVRRFAEYADAHRWMALCAPFDVALFDHSVVQPDLVLIAPDRFGGLRDRMDGAPTLAVEIVSPSTGRRDRVWKLKLFAEAGIPEYWIVDERSRTIDLLVLGAAGRYEIGMPEAGVWRSPHAPGLELELARFWAQIDAVLARIPG